MYFYGSWEAFSFYSLPFKDSAFEEVLRTVSGDLCHDGNGQACHDPHEKIADEKMKRAAEG